MRMKMASGWVWLALVGVAATLMSCSSASESTCATRFECEQGQVCLAGQCDLPAPDGSCTNDNECLIGDICVGRLCVDDDPVNNDDNNDPPPNNDNNDPPPPNNDDNNDPPPPNNDIPDDCGNGVCNASEDEESCPEDCEPDREPPQVVSVSPDIGQTGVSTNTLIAITFSEPVRAFGLEQKIVLSNADTLETVEFVAGQEGSVVTLQPTAPLLDGTPYQVLVTSQNSDERGNRLPDDYRWYFSTAVAPEAEHARIAQEFAPVIYQEVDSNSVRGDADFFTAIDFDGDFNASNNGAAFRDADLPMRAYYSVMETFTHVFVQYLYYFPAYHNINTNQTHEHDMTAVLVVLARDGDDLRFVMSETGYRSQFFGFAVEGEGIDDRNQGKLELTFPREALVDGKRAPIYIGRNFHGACHWLWRPEGFAISTAPWCIHDAEAFRDPDESAVFYPGGGSLVSQLDCDANDPNVCDPELGITCQETVCTDEQGIRAQSYSLEDFREDLWVRRINISGNDQLFNGRSTYRPHESSGQRPGAGENRKYPATLESSDSNSRGEMPFIWEAPGAISAGQWWLDPAYSLSESFRFGEDVDSFSTTYCYNPYFDIDQRGQDGCP